MILEQVVVGPFESNCWILGCEETRQAAIIDPGDEAERILQILESHRLTPAVIIATHGHLDHVGALSALRQHIDSPILIHLADIELLENLPLQATMFGLQAEAAPAADGHLNEGNLIQVGNLHLRVLETPGHSPGSICLRIEPADPVEIFTGDTVFRGSIGRTDLWDGSYPQLIRSIREKLGHLPDSTLLHPGHGPSTTLGHERHHNPFLTNL